MGGMWQKGQTGNPLGRPKKMSVAQLARSHAPDVINRLVFWLHQEETPSASIRAAEILLDRAFGKSVQPIADGSNHEALELDLNNVSYQELQRYEKTLVKLLSHTHQINDAIIDVTEEAEKAASEVQEITS
jgi:hypothetical protein